MSGIKDLTWRKASSIHPLLRVTDFVFRSFGTASMVMSLIPLASIVFTFTTTVGAALWAVEMERGNTSAPGDTVDAMGRELHTQE